MNSNNIALYVVWQKNETFSQTQILSACDDNFLPTWDSTSSHVYANLITFLPSNYSRWLKFYVEVDSNARSMLWYDLKVIRLTDFNFKTAHMTVIMFSRHLLPLWKHRNSSAHHHTYTSKIVDVSIENKVNNEWMIMIINGNGWDDEKKMRIFIISITSLNCLSISTLKSLRFFDQI